MSNKAPLHANPSKNRTPRHRAREFALQGLYQWLLNNEDVGAIEAHIREAHGFDKADAAHFDALLYGAIKDVEALRASLSPLIDRSIKELSPVEHAALLISAAAMQLPGSGPGYCDFPRCPPMFPVLVFSDSPSDIRLS
jgi:N utilization substance protein B